MVTTKTWPKGWITPSARGALGLPLERACDGHGSVPAGRSLRRIVCRAMSVLLTCLVSAHLSPDAAVSQERAIPSVAAGKAIAERLCSGCHLMAGHSEAVVPAGVITLHGIANKPGQTGERIRDTLLLPHAPMPDARLTIGEITSILLYLESLRTNPAVPPLVGPDENGQKPAYPKST